MVLESRRALGVSQKELSDALAKEGLILDNSAISRIEKGTRALRLSEAIVLARVLRFSLAEFEEAVPPAEDFARRRKSTDDALEIAHRALTVAADELSGLAFVVEGHPEVLRDVTFDDQPAGAVELMDFLVQKWHSNFMHNALGTRFESEELRDAVRRVLHAVATTAVDEYAGPDDE
ncbi:helix-turn-helix domain-containing protein [Curtobacterium luteum]|uniref:helix-turn-helix domain-containing protein n=1 Tax=Curtobacterium luteum TaxID=33881 RepID=UPI00381B2A11